MDASGTDSNDRTSFISYKMDSDVQGIGPKVGLDAGFNLCWGFQLLGDASVAVLFGSMKAFYLDFNTSSTPLNAVFISGRVDPTNIVIGNFEGFLGLGYNDSLGCCGELLAEVGYRLSYFTHGVVRAQFFDDVNEALSRVTTQSFALDGFVFKLGISY